MLEMVSQEVDRKYKIYGLRLGGGVLVRWELSL